MQVRNTTTGAVFECSDELGERLVAGGGYDKVGARTPSPAPAAVEPPAPPQQQKQPTTTRKTHS